MGLLLQGGSANIADIQFEGGAGNKTVTIPAAGGTVVTGTGNQTIGGTKSFTSSPLVPTPTAGDDSTKVATTAYVDGKIVRSASVTASGTSMDFTSIPSWAKQITILLNGVSTSGTSILQVQIITSDGVVTTGYAGSSTVLDSSVGYSTYSTGFIESNKAGAAAYLRRGKFELANTTSNIWVETHHISANSAGAQMMGAGAISLGEALTGVRITTVNGTDTFDAGSINIIYQG